MTASIQGFERSYNDSRSALPGQQLAWLQQRRDQGIALLKAQGLPGPKTEDWKYTPVQDLLQQQLAPADAAPQLPADIFRAVPAAHHLVVLVNGHFSAELSRCEQLPAGLEINSLAQVLASSPQRLRELLGSVASLDKQPFAALNTGFISDGVYLSLAPNIRIEQPLWLLNLTTGDGPPQLTQPRILIDVGKNARFTLMEYQHADGSGHCCNQLSEIMLADGAQLSHLHLQRPGNCRLLRGTHVRCERDSHYCSHNVDLGGALLRNDLVVQLTGSGAGCELNGLYLLGSGEHVDNHTRIDHLAPHCRSREYYKGILGGKAHGVFNGKVIVHPGAQQSDAQQSNRNLLLSHHVEIDTKPELEIYADDVQCSHGSTVSELEPEPLFYLRCRGIGDKQARMMLVQAFADEMCQRLPLGALRDEIEHTVQAFLQTLLDTFELEHDRHDHDRRPA